MHYFEVAMHELGFRGKWNLDYNVNVYDVPAEDYMIAGRFEI